MAVVIWGSPRGRRGTNRVPPAWGGWRLAMKSNKAGSNTRRLGGIAQAALHQSFHPWLEDRLRRHTLGGEGRQLGSIGVGRNIHTPIAHDRWTPGHYIAHT
eukprot:5654557-Amphidinium_carterae.4